MIWYILLAFGGLLILSAAMSILLQSVFSFFLSLYSIAFLWYGIAKWGPISWPPPLWFWIAAPFVLIMIGLMIHAEKEIVLGSGDEHRARRRK